MRAYLAVVNASLGQAWFLNLAQLMFVSIQFQFAHEHFLAFFGAPVVIPFTSPQGQEKPGQVGGINCWYL